MNRYQQSIVLFGFAVPAVIAALIIGGGIYAKGRASASLEQKISHYKGFEKNKRAAFALEAEVSQKREHFERWERQLSEETASAVTSNLRQIEELLPAKEFQKTAQEHPSGKSGFGSASAQSSAQVRLSFRATFRSMQKAFLELESRMPQLQMQDLRIDPSSGSNNLNVSVTYTAWEK